MADNLCRPLRTPPFPSLPSFPMPHPLFLFWPQANGRLCVLLAPTPSLPNPHLLRLLLAKAKGRRCMITSLSSPWVCIPIPTLGPCMPARGGRSGFLNRPLFWVSLLSKRTRKRKIGQQCIITKGHNISSPQVLPLVQVPLRLFTHLCWGLQCWLLQLQMGRGAFSRRFQRL